MLTTYYTLRALAREWRPDLVGAVVGDVYSQSRDELTIALARPETTWTLRVAVRPHPFAFRSEGYSRARRNVATLFEDAFDRRVADLRIAERDRMLFLDLEGGGGFRFALFGPRANIFLTEAEGRVVEAFQADAEWEGQPAPAPRPAPRVETPEDFEARWRADRKTAARALARAVPLFDATLAREALHRAGLALDAAADLGPEARARLFDAARALGQSLEGPAPRIYWDGRFADTLALVPLGHLEGLEEEAFATVDEAVRVFVRKELGQARFRTLYAPLERALEAAEAHHRRSAAKMLDELQNPSRADRYERWGHLLMATPGEVPPGADEATLPDLFEDHTPVTIPLDARRSAVENAQRYYDKARRTRAARAHAEDRMVAADEAADEAALLLGALREIEHVRELEQFRKREAARLARFAGVEVEAADRLPFRRYALGQGYEVWVGRNAKQNDQLTFRHAQKYDVWMHARGVPGSHAVLRKPNRDATPPRPIVERAAAIAAYHSKARGSGLVPVMMTERKYVRKPRGGAPGAVLVEREEVVLVEPGLPAAVEAD